MRAPPAFRVLRSLSVPFLVAVGLHAAPAQAEPQILGVIASSEPVTLQCLRDECFAEFSAFCLQRTYASPQTGTLYRPANDEMVSLVGVSADGRRIALPVDDMARITALRGHSAVKVAIDRQALAIHGVTHVEAAFARRAALVPAVETGVGQPQTPATIAAATGPLRVLAEGLVDNGGPRAQAAQIASAMTNALPPGGRVDEKARQDLWDRVSGSALAKGMAPEALDLAKRAHRQCLQPWTSMRTCLSSHHDILIGKLNNEYWSETERMF